MEENKKADPTAEEQFDAVFEAGHADPASSEAEESSGEEAQEQGTEEQASAEAEPSPDGKEAPSSSEALEELRKKAHGYDSMMGRLNQEQKRRAELEAELERLRRAPASAETDGGQAQREPSQPAAKTVELDEGMRALVEGLPENLRGVFHEDSADGTRLRKVMEEFGPEQASILAEVVVDHRTELSARQRRETSQAEEVRRSHFATLSEKFPDFAPAFAGDAVQLRVLQDGIEQFIGHLPYGEGTRLARIAREGTTEEVAELLEKYTAYRSGSGSGTDAKKVEQAAKDGYAVPTRSVPQLNNKRVPPDDFDAAFDEAVKAPR